MFNSEKPIEKIEQDILGRSNTAKELSRHILGYKSDDSLTIGIIGEWGSGKTSFINMTLEVLENNKDYIIFHFNPWNISTRKQLISDFFSQLSNEIGKINKEEILKDVSKNLHLLSKIFEPATLVPIPQISIFASLAKKFLKIIGDFFNKAAEFQKSDLNEIKEDLNNSLEKFGKKILIIVDDIDRLSDNDIKEIFQLVKSIADFKNTIYILSYDNKIVSEALNNLQNGKGEEYLEKIIQVPIILPHISKSQINKVFLNKLEKILAIPDEEFDKSYWNELYSNGFSNNLTNLRDVERYLNSFSFGFNTIKDELNIIDYMAVTLFKVFEPQLYKYIQENEEYFTGVKFGGEFEINPQEDREKIKKELEELFDNLKKINKENARDMIKTIFPKIEGLYSGSSYDYSFIQKWNAERKIASPKYFPFYFSLDFPENEIKKSELKKIINFSSKEELKKGFNVNNSKKIELLDRIFEIVEKVPTNKTIEFLQVILSLTDELKSENSDGILSFLEAPSFKTRKIFDKIFEKIPKEIKYYYIKDIFEDEKCSLESLFSILESIKENQQEYNISENQINVLMSMLLKRIIKRSEEAEYIPKYLLDILHSMKKMGRYEEAKIVFNNYLKNKKLLIPLIGSFVGVTVSEKNYQVVRRKYIRKSDIDNFIDYNLLKEIVNACVENPTPEDLEIIGYLRNPKLDNE